MSCGHLALLLVTLKRQSRGQGPYYLFQGSNPAQQAETGRQAGGGQSAGPAPTSSPHSAAGPAPPLPSQHPWHGHPHSHRPLTSCPAVPPLLLLANFYAPHKAQGKGPAPRNPPGEPAECRPGSLLQALSVSLAAGLPSGQGRVPSVGSGPGAPVTRRNPARSQPWMWGSAAAGGLDPGEWEPPTEGHGGERGPPLPAPGHPVPMTSALPPPRTCPLLRAPAPPEHSLPTSHVRGLEGGLPPPRARPAEAREVRPRAQPPHRPDAEDGTSPHSPSP